MALPNKCRDLSLQPLNRRALTVQRVPSSYPCPVEDSNTNCTLFAVTDASWEALASYLGMSISRFGQSPVIPTLMLYQVIPSIALNSSQLLDGVSYSTALQNEYLTVLKSPTDPSGTMYVKPTGAPKGLLIERDISAALGKLHIVRGPLVPASLVPLLTGGTPSELPIYGLGSPQH
ncbi:hypothetical protein CVIRNUC_009314 [Coccomyxa viridis]|uniref:Uncharacterized protein n=1 Tax=Coccomyxa viridis TaxID=1274662 RepID=A0AAV1IH19_9CHLO|nr:hypothetical protein CVIRNUC_009314 [Coccomyxa viridis]